jgi:predicted DNA-binding transcriptional regulator YafY
MGTHVSLPLNREHIFVYNTNKNRKAGCTMNQLFRRSINEHIPVEVIYLSEDQKFSQRKLIVKEMHNDYIRAYCLLRKQVRTFRIDNILSVMPVARSNNLLH